MCFQALLMFGETNPLPDLVTAPSLSRPSVNSSKALSVIAQRPQ